MSVTGRLIVIVLGIVIGIVAATLIVRSSVRDSQKAAPGDHDGIAGPAGVKANADVLKATLVTPHLACAISKDQNLLWCATFQLAWNELCDLLGGSITPEARSDTVALLNERSVTAADLDDGSYVALAGHPTGGADDILDRIAAALKENLAGPRGRRCCPIGRLSDRETGSLMRICSKPCLSNGRLRATAHGACRLPDATFRPSASIS